MKSTEDLVNDLSSRLFTTKGVREISDILEELVSDKTFKRHTSAIVADTSLTDPQKRRQLSYVLKVIDNPVLIDFFDEVLAKKEFWVFSSGKVDYFDHFVQQFQMSTEELGLIYLVTAIELDPSDLKEIAIDLSKSFGYKVIIKHEVNPAILGGAQVRVENYVFDLSLRTKFQQFQRAWLLSLNKTTKMVGRNQPETI